MTDKDLEEIKQKYGFTLRPSAFNGKPIKYVSKEEYEKKIKRYGIKYLRMIQKKNKKKSKKS